MLSIDQWLEEKPYREVYDNRIYEKTGGSFTHGVIMGHVGMLLNEWCSPFGGVGHSLRVYLAPGVSLCPDVAFVSDKRLAPLTEDEQQTPPFAPDIVAEIRAPGDRDANVDRKRDLYLAHGSTMVLDVDPQSRTVRLSSRDGEQLLHLQDTIEHPALLGLQIPVQAIFEPLNRERKGST